MAQEQPSLEAKKTYFAQWKPLPHSDDETDAVDANAEGQVDDDELDPREQRMRHRHRRFFRKASPREAAASEADPRAQEYYSKEEMGDEVQETPGDEVVVVVVTSSAQATPAVKKKPAKASSKRNRNVVDGLLQNDGDDDVEFIGETPIDATKRRRASAKSAEPSRPPCRPPPKLQSWSSSSTTRKRNKEGQVNMRPEGEQIFRGLVFYYVPDNEIAPARRLRMQKAREYGAARTSDAAQATHIIVDRDIGYRDAEKAVARKRDGVVIVNEDYPIECVQFRALLDGKQKRYMLAGQPEEEEAGGEQRTTVEAKVEKAGEKEVVCAKEKLRLSEPSRNPKKWNTAPEATPPNASEASPGIDSQPIVLDVHTARDEAQACEAPQTESAKRRSTAPGDELTEVIDMMQEFKDLPLDNDDEEETVSPASHDSSSEDDRASQRRAPAPKKAAPASAGPSLERFACAHAGSLDAHASSANARTVQVLQAMLSYYERTSDTWRVMAYRRAIATLRRQPTKISSAREALRLPGVGQRLAAKIEEIATTDRLQRLEHAERDDDDGGGANAALRLFLGVHGVGPALAAQWAAWGMRTLEDVVRKDSGIRLTPGQRLGIERYEDLHTKIPRDEVEALAAVVRAEAARIDAAVEITIGGSYRRGAPVSGDVDMMLSRPDTTCAADLAPFLRELVTRLQRSGFIVATLAGGGGSDSSSSSSSSSIWQGCCVLPGGSGRFRRMDLLVVPETEMGGALIYFTGDDVFNRSLRLLARKRGMRLNQKGLYKRIESAAAAAGENGRRGRRGMVAVEGDLVEGRCERRIFEILGVEWREPTERWC
ncbi:DNA polymerase POL4, putative [Beauveria bassiana ARSEF 2860]|uniref:DNA polymerase lambda n=1 Tax=Beauveria bassiana (strain ARSEF 2860) TaxID=655819 RepID=J5K9X6_BEAB2|nr:DNA polymerase POL4, putative [Beauveria bassiana ARSEF 2860]EJP70956.1 DNA polymerase POL4, putative [Beauveria bassiana ARSEF 2860]